MVRTVLPDINILENDADVDPDTVEISTVTGPINGTATINGTDNGITYTPDAGFVGNDTLVYTITDGNGAFDAAEVTITVEEVNTAPVANDDS